MAAAGPAVAPPGAATPPDECGGWVELSLRVDPADADLIAEALGSLAPGAVAVEPVIESSERHDFQAHELDEPALIRAFFPAPFPEIERRRLRRTLAALPLEGPLPRLRYRAVEEHDWAAEWRRFFKVLHVGRRIVVRPSWEPYRPRAGEVVIDLDPGAAFGTGQHETTRLCLLALERLLRPGSEVIDLGAGSGILAVAAARLGARMVRELDVDAGAVAVARQAAARNGVAACVTAAEGSLGAAWPWRQRAQASADLIVANISSTVLIELMPEIRRALRPGGIFIGSGFLAASVAEVEAATARAGLRRLSIDAESDWRCLAAVAAPQAAPQKT